MIYFLSVYFLLLWALIISDLLFLLNTLGLITVSLASFGLLLWMMAILLFTITVFTTLTTEKGEMRFSNFGITLLMYFTYSKLWMVVAVYGLYQFILDALFKRKTVWYKTERY
jgi:hypothetical protein